LPDAAEAREEVALLAPFSHRLAQRDGEGAALRRLATEAPAVILVLYVEEADRAKCSQGGCICSRSSQFMRNGVSALIRVLLWMSPEEGVWRDSAVQRKGKHPER
jgi:hypothetical protein